MSFQFLKLTNQQIFEHVLTHMRKQGKASVTKTEEYNDLPFCSYRGDDGSACAIGCLMLDSEYKTWFEGRPVVDLTTFSSDFLTALQRAHDVLAGESPSDFLPAFDHRMKLIARDFDLQYIPASTT